MNPEMKRPAILTAVFVRQVTRPGRYGDGRGGHGLSLLVARRKNGRTYRRWTQRITINGRATSTGLGVYPAVTLAEARRRALRNRRDLAEGRNPLAIHTPTFRQATKTVISLHAPQWKPGGRTEEHWRASLAAYAFPVIGNRSVSAITSAHVMACVSPLWHNRPEMARKVLRRIGAVMTWSIAQGHRADNPASRAVITAALGRNTNGGGHFAALHFSKVADALAVIGRSGAHVSTILATRFLALTATRSGEVRLATWDEINFATATWEIPAERTKTGNPHRVPLSTAALAVLGEVAAYGDGSGLVFPSSTGRTMSNSTISKLFKENDIGCVPHGLRSSFRDWCGETGVAREVAEAALGHVVPGVEGAYARSDLLDRRREVMESWAGVIRHR